MSGSSCVDPIAYNYNPIADLLGTGDYTSCQYSSFINFGCTYVNALNFDATSNFDDGSCEYNFTDLNNDGDINIFDVIILIESILNN